MKGPATPIFVVGCVHLLLVLNPRLTTSQEVEDESEFDYLEGSGKGPDKWGELHEEWKACQKGVIQSPIDMTNERVEVVQKFGKLKRNYMANNATLKNRGHDIMLEWKDAGSLKINGSEHTLHQCHWHSPSEHSINGKRYDLELHLVHSNDFTNKTVVVGIMYNIGRPDQFLTELEKHILTVADSHEEVKVGVVDPRHIKMGGIKYYRYTGSLTVPPCSEGVIWIINKRVRTISQEQVNLLRHAVHDYAETNARPLQPHNDRTVHLIDPMVFQERS